jgi:predicted short-subunit dehydrogenase-like oxidoreductase (DUF2520 family)
VKRPRIAVIGAGAAGVAVARALRRSGWPVAAVCRRNAARAKAAARLVGGGARAFTDAVRAARGADLVVLAVRDGEIARVAASLAERGAVAPGALVVHLAGAVPSTALAPLRAAGARTAALHPLPTFAGGDAAVPGVYWFHEGDARAECAALVRRLGGRFRSIDPARKAVYHAAAVAASNYLVAVADLATRMATAAGVPPKDALRALLPLIRGTVRNLEREGLPGALTGPVARGDAATVARHRKALRAVDPDLVDAYDALAWQALPVAIRKGLPPAAVRALQRALK